MTDQNPSSQEPESAAGGSLPIPLGSRQQGPVFHSQDVSRKPGVYVFRNQAGEVIYVGKAKNLRNRMRSYFMASTLQKSDPRRRALIHSIASYQTFEVESETEAFLLESQFIKQYHPRYNVEMRDDKRFLHICVDLTETFPKLRFARIRRDDGCLYFGPFPQTTSLRETVRILEIRFGLRSCKIRDPDAESRRHCLEHIIRDCCSPCLGKLTAAEYRVRLDQALAPNLKTYAENRVNRIFSESEYVSNQGVICGNFAELAFWLGAQLMVDPAQDSAPLIAEFMQLYYGPSEKPMTEMLHCLMTAMQNEPGDIGLQGVTSKYLTKDFFEKINSLLDEAEKAVGNDSKVLPRISQERIACDYGMLYFKERFNLNFDRQKVIERLYRNEQAAMIRFSPETQHQAIRNALKGKYEMMVKELPIPKQFEGKNVWDFPCFKFSKTWTTEWESDPEAAAGRAMKFTGIFATQKVIPDGYHARELAFGLYDRVGEKHLIMKNVPREQMARDEKYHWYHVGRSALKLKSMIWLHWSWQVYLFCGDDLYDPLSPDVEYDLWLSIKLEGPSYSPDSKKQDAILLDRVIFTRK